MEPTKEALNEGILNVIADKPLPTTKDIYNITSDIHDVLVIEICKLQRSEDTIKDCLTVQQDNLSKLDHKYDMFGIGAVILSFVIIVICFFMMMRGRK